VILLLACVLAIALTPAGLPLGVGALGVVEGAALIPVALGMILVYRSDRIINFAQVQAGLTGGALFAQLSLHLSFVAGLQQVCPPCLAGSLRSAPGWMQQANFWLSVVAALLLSTTVSWLGYIVVLRRFRAAPRLVMTVATIGLAEFFAGISAWLPDLFRNPNESLDAIAQGSAGFVGIPYHLQFSVAGVNFGATDVATVAAAVIACLVLAVVLRATRVGVAVRASADNPTRAETLGTNVTAVSAGVWLSAGFLSGLAGVISASAAAAGPASGLGVEALAGILTVALAARFVSLPAAAVSALLLGVVDQGLFHVTKVPVTFQLVEVLLVAAFLLAQSGRRSRAEAEAAESWLAAREVRPIPAEIRSLGPVRNYRFYGAALLLTALVVFPFVASPAVVNAGAVVVVYAMLGLSLLVLTGWAGQISLGQFGFAAIGAAVTSLLAANYGVPFPFSVIGGGLAGAVLALAVGLPALRLSGLNLAITTLVLAIAVSNFVINRAYLGAGMPLQLSRPLFLGLDFEDDRAFFLFCIVVLAAIVALVVALRRTRPGRALIAARDNELAAQSLGVNLLRTRLAAFGISGFIAAAAGGLLAFAQHGVQPLSYLPDVSVAVFLMAVIGGMGSIAGPLVGAVYVGVLLVQPLPILQFFGTGLGVLLLLMVAPGGLSQLYFAARDAFLRRVALRYRVNVPSLLGDRGTEVGAPAPIRPKTRPGGGTIFVPLRYVLDEEPPLGSRP